MFISDISSLRSCFCFGSSHFLRAHLTSPLPASLCLGYHEVLASAARVLRSHWMTPLLIPVRGEPIRRQLLWLHVHSCSLRAQPESHTARRNTRAVDAGCFQRPARVWWWWFMDTKQTLQEEETSAAAQEAQHKTLHAAFRSDLKLESLQKNGARLGNTCRTCGGREGEREGVCWMHVNGHTGSGSSRTRG